MQSTKTFKKTKFFLIVFICLLAAAVCVLAVLRVHRAAPSGSAAPDDLAAFDAALLENIKIMENFQDTVTGKLLKEWGKRLGGGDTVQLSRQDFEMLKNALEDLDQRTAAFEKLPDGRIRIGNISTGSPTVVIREHAAALKLFNEGNYKAAFERSKKAISSLEASDSFQMNSAGGELESRDEAKVYRLAVLSALHMRSNNDEALKFAEKAVKMDPSTTHRGLLADTYYNAGRYSDAMDLIQRVLMEEPNNETWKNLKTAIEQNL